MEFPINLSLWRTEITRKYSK